MKLGKRQELFARNICRLMEFAFDMGYEIRIGEVWRPDVMAKIYSGNYQLINKRTGKIADFPKKGISNSLHIMKTAADLNLFKDGEYLLRTEDHKQLGDFWESLHPYNRWGGRYKDGNHYEMLNRPREEE